MSQARQVSQPGEGFCWHSVLLRQEEPLNRVVARFADGRMLKGMTADFFPAKNAFHVSPADSPPGTDPIEVHTSDLKALFFVKDLAGDPTYVERKDFDSAHPTVGRRIRVVFKDGEVLVGTTTGYSAERAGFFVEPADPGSNNERCFVVSAATQEIGFL